MNIRVIGVSFAILCWAICLGCGGGSSSGSNGSSSAGAQTWIIDAGPDPVQNGREEEATVVIQPFTYSGTFNEVQPDPLGGMLVYSPDGSCNYQVSVGGSIANGDNSTTWMLSGSTGSGCGMSTIASGTLTGIGTFPTSTSAGGNITFSTQSPLGTAVDSGQWNASIQSGGSQIVMRRQFEEKLHNPKILYDILRAFQPIDFRH
jgi:hypothetical protein